MNEIIKKIKYSRLTPVDRYLIELMLSLEQFENPKFKNSIFFKKENKVIAEYTTINKEMYVIWDISGRILESLLFNVNLAESKQLFKQYFELYFKIEITHITYNKNFDLVDITVKNSHKS